MPAGRSWRPGRYSCYKNWTEVSILHLIPPYKHKFSMEDSFRMDAVPEEVDFAEWDWSLLPLSTVHEWGGRGNGTGGAAACLFWLPLEYSLEQPFVTFEQVGMGISSSVPSFLWCWDMNPGGLRIWRNHCPFPASQIHKVTWNNCWWVSVKGGGGFRVRICLSRVAEKNLIWINKICELKVDYQCHINGWIP